MKSRTFNARELLEQADDFERVIKAGEKYCDVRSRVSRLLCALFAMKSAFLIRRSLGSADDLCEVAKDGVGDAWETIEQQGLPGLDTVHSAVQKLRGGVASSNRVATVSALEEMGVFALCPIPSEQLWRMERLAGNVSGRARLVFLVELMLFAGELDNFDAVRKYVSETWGLVPSGWELYNLCVFEGLFALEAGNLDEAVQFLGRALRACQTDEHTLISCGLCPPNFILAQRLFERGAHGATLRHLVDCKTVWQRSWMPVDKWINLIGHGQTPDFDDCEGLKSMSLPSCRLDLQWMRARALASAKEPSPAVPSRSLAEVVAAKEEFLADVDRHISTKVNDAIRYLDSDEAESPDR
jgi:hypothetical protein